MKQEHREILATILDTFTNEGPRDLDVALDAIDQTLKPPREAIKQLKEHQQQLDADGVRVGVSRQALEEVLEHLGEREEA